MKKLRGKLNSENGAVIVIALLFFLVCALVAAVIVAAASMNAGRIEKRYDEQKAYLAASSATQMLQKNLAGMTFKAEKTDKEYTCRQTHNDKDGTWTQTLACDKSVYFNEFITNSAMAICKGNTTASHTANYTLNADELSDVTTTVNVEMFADDTKKYDVKCVIKSKTLGGSSYTMSLFIKASNGLTESTQTYSKSDKHEASAGATGASWDDDLRKWVIQYDYTVITTTLTVTWPEGTIQKGDAS